MSMYAPALAGWGLPFLSLDVAKQWGRDLCYGTSGRDLRGAAGAGARRAREIHRHVRLGRLEDGRSRS